MSGEGGGQRPEGPTSMGDGVFGLAHLGEGEAAAFERLEDRVVAEAALAPALGR